MGQQILYSILHSVYHVKLLLVSSFAKLNLDSSKMTEKLVKIF